MGSGGLYMVGEVRALAQEVCGQGNMVGGLCTVAGLGLVLQLRLVEGSFQEGDQGTNFPSCSV